MSEGPSDPDLLDLDDLPDTGTFVDGSHDPGGMYRLLGGVKALGRWATRTAKARKDEQDAAKLERDYIRGLAFKIIGTVVAGALGMIGTVVAAAIYIGSRLERFESYGPRLSRLESAILGVDETTHATEGEP